MAWILCGSSAHLATSSRQQLSIWFDSTAGQRLVAEQQELLHECARRFHGDALLWVGCHTPLVNTVRGCMVRHHLAMAPASDDEGNELACFSADVHELPLPNGCLDAVILHHALETAEDPRTAIREIARVLTPGGRLVVCGFNPLSLWGVRGAYASVITDSFSGLRFVNPVRLLDWLTVLGFERQDEVKYLAYGLPFARGGSDAKMWRKLRNLLTRHQLPIGGVYLLSAVKQALANLPEAPRQRLRRAKLAPVAYPKLSSWNRTERPG